MKKFLLIVCLVVFLTGCSNKVTIDFKDSINMQLDLSFTLDEYKAYSNRNSNSFNSNEETNDSIEAIRNDREAFINGNNALFKEKTFTNTNNNYTASYEYNYSYANFSNSSVLNSCFDYFGVKNYDDIIYVSLAGDSICAPFKLTIKADNRMINNNSTNVKNNEYTWNVQEKNNNIYFSISKTPMNNSSINILYIIYFAIGIVLAFIAYILKRKYKR